MDTETKSTEKQKETSPKIKFRAKRRKIMSESSSDAEDYLPENFLEVEKNLQASALKNNLDQSSVKKILKKVVANDHVLAYVMLREEEEENQAKQQQEDEESKSHEPKITRSKAKELQHVSPQTKTPWALQNLALTPIKHIPVKTRPEVTALIAQELHEDEDDDEYQPTHDDLPSDDDHTDHTESCSDLDSQPRTPLTPHSQVASSPVVVQDGPFKVPQQDIKSITRRRLQLEEEATIALRTRSKLSLSATPIEHIESSFVPPDEVPLPYVDDLWSEFLVDCLNPASVTRNEDDDDDPEYSVAADPDAADEEEDLESSIIKISKKELSDLVTELFHIMPEESEIENIPNNTIDNNTTGVNDTTGFNDTTRLSDTTGLNDTTVDNTTSCNKDLVENNARTSIGKEQPMVTDEVENNLEANICTSSKTVDIEMVERVSTIKPAVEKAPKMPNLLKETLENETSVHAAELNPDMETIEFLPMQVLILQQQIRQHIQLATSNFLQLFIHPIHWNMAPKYKEYVNTFEEIIAKNPKSTANVCNVKPASDLMRTWEETVSADTPENRAMVKDIQAQIDKSRRNRAHNNTVGSHFHPHFLKIISNSPVFLYPHLLPPAPYRADEPRKFAYLESEDELIAIGLDQFWDHVEKNQDIFKIKKTKYKGNRWGFAPTVDLLCKVMFPWCSVKSMSNHIDHVKRFGDPENAIVKFFKNREITPYKHKLLPFNPQLTLYQQPVEDMPIAWVKHISKTSKRAKLFLRKRSKNPKGVDIDVIKGVKQPIRAPLPIDFRNSKEKLPLDIPIEKQPVQITTNYYQIVQTSTGSFLLPTEQTNNQTSSQTNIIANSLPEGCMTKVHVDNIDHCDCCVLLRKYSKRQSVLEDYYANSFGSKCECDSRDLVDRLTSKLRLFVEYFRAKSKNVCETLDRKIEALVMNKPFEEASADDVALVNKFTLKLIVKMTTLCNYTTKRRLFNTIKKFDTKTGCPLDFAKDIKKYFGENLTELYSEFVVLLNAQQADELGMIRHYFVQYCVPRLIDKVEQQITNKETRLNVLKAIKDEVVRPFVDSCKVCTRLLLHLRDYSELTQFVFSMFPHRYKECMSPSKIKTLKTSVAAIEREYEADHSESEDENISKTANQPVCTRVEKNTKNQKDLDESDEEYTFYIKEEADKRPSQNNVDGNNVDGSDSDTMPMLVMSDDEIKNEPDEWKKDEDKIILQVIKENFANKTECSSPGDSLDLLEELLQDRSREEISERVTYLLELLA